MEANHAEIRQRGKLLAIALAAVAVGLIARYYAGPGWLRNGLGAILYELCWIAVVQAWWVRSSTLRISVGVFAATCGVELLQLSHHAWLVAIRATLAGRLVLGSNGGFDEVDFLWYLIGSSIGCLLIARVLGHGWQGAPRCGNPVRIASQGNRHAFAPPHSSTVGSPGKGGGQTSGSTQHDPSRSGGHD